MKKLQNYTAVKREEVKTQADLDNMARVAAQHGFDMSAQGKARNKLMHYGGRYLELRLNTECFQDACRLESGTKITTLEEFLSYDMDIKVCAPANLKTYEREITGKCGNKVVIDVYRVLDAYQTNNPILDHITKKALCAGKRGHKDMMQDLQNIKESIIEAMALESQKEIG